MQEFDKQEAFDIYFHLFIPHVQMSYEAERFDNRWIMLRRKREKLEMQLSEAIWIKNSIVRRTPKVKRHNKFCHTRTKN